MTKERKVIGEKVRKMWLWYSGEEAYNATGVKTFIAALGIAV